MTQLIRGWTKHLTPPVPGWQRTDLLDRGLVAEWRFDPASGLMLPDYSGRGHHVTMPAGGTWITDRYGPALDFPGNIESSSFVVALGGKTGTMESFFRNDQAAPANRRVIGRWWQNDSLGTHDGAPDRWAVRFNDTIADSPGGVPADTYWHHLCGTYDGTLGAANIKLYLDGILIKTANENRDFNHDDATWRIGSHGAADYYWDGAIAEIRLYTRCLSGAEVRARYEICLKRARPMTHPWMLPWGKAPEAPPPVGGHMTLWGRYWGP